MTAKNDITGDRIATKESTEAYADGWERIFGAKKNVFAEFDVLFLGDIAKVKPEEQEKEQ
jgi:hypothetical protein